MPAQKKAAETAHSIPRSNDAPVIIGYARTSTVDQNLTLQTAALAGIGAVHTFTDRLSGGYRKRPGLEGALAALRPGDTLAVWKLDRLGRDLAHLVLTIDELQRRGIRFRSITEAIDSMTPHGRLLLGIFGTLAEYERALTSERIIAGIAARRNAGSTIGRPRRMSADRIAAARALRETGKTWRQIATILGIARSTVLVALQHEDLANGEPVRPRWRPRKIEVQPADWAATAAADTLFPAPSGLVRASAK